MTPTTTRGRALDQFFEDAHKVEPDLLALVKARVAERPKEAIIPTDLILWAAEEIKQPTETVREALWELLDKGQLVLTHRGVVPTKSH